jgi:hypothetical protein
MAQGKKARLSGAGMLSIGRDVLHATLKIGERDLRMLRRYVLIWLVIDGIARQFLPVPRPIDAEPAIGVVHE